jgi:hypothetical protein
VGCALALGFATPAAQAYTAETPPWVIEGSERAAKEAVEQRERENSEAAARKASEQQAVEGERAAGETAVRQPEQGQGAGVDQPAGAPPPCIVPMLRGHSLAGARRLLRVSHCSLGKVHVRRTAHENALVVIAQGAKQGSELAAASAVAVRLGRLPATVTRKPS